jgi:hypothetical protein
MKSVKDRKSKLISKKKLIIAINFFEKYIDEEISNIEINRYSYPNTYSITTKDLNEYLVDISNNKIIKKDNYDFC